MAGYHKSVLLREAINALDVKPGSWYLDCTLGDGGHSIEILKQGGKVIGIDVDPEALKRTRERLGNLGYLARLPARQGNLVLIQGNFRDIKSLIQQQTDLAKSNLAGAKSNLAGAVFDLGVSSLQLETPARGFSFAKEGLLDMRMDLSLQVTALDLLNTLSRKELYELFLFLGEEKYSRRLADTLVSAHKIRPITTTTQLAEIVVRVVGGFRGNIPAYVKASAGKHPATRVFQALRIAVNDELGALQEGLDQVKDLIEENGRIVVISFHSLEDRIVKNTFKKWAGEGVGKIMTKKPLAPTKMEISENPKSRSAKMRVFKVT